MACDHVNTVHRTVVLYSRIPVTNKIQAYQVLICARGETFQEFIEDFSVRLHLLLQVRKRYCYLRFTDSFCCRVGFAKVVNSTGRCPLALLDSRCARFFNKELGGSNDNIQ